MIQREIRNYEISIWTLQDDFITVLKYSDIEYKGQTQEGEMQLNIDGTQTLSFTIPMYLHKNNQLVENPAWYNYINGNIIANMRKIKVILNKLTPNEEIFEFIITKVTETHEKGELKCAVECEGLAFHELGKTGYKVSLKQEDFEFDSGCFYGLYVEDGHPKGQWNNPIKNVPDTTEPIANIEYWANKFLVPYPQDGLLNPRIWYYKVEMDWSGYTNWKWENEENILIARASNKIYEDEYVGNWRTSGTTTDNYVLEADTLVGYMEKARLMDSEESNKYNLSQDLAEKFGVYCKYVYEHDDTYHIIGRYVVFYNSFIEEQKGAIDITYKYNAKKIEREMDGTDLVTKMYVKSVEDETTDSGLISIIDVEANKTREDYIFNFDYMYNIGAISEESYKKIAEHEKRLRYYNDKLVPLSKQITELQFKKPEIKANVTFYENAVKLDTENIQAQSDWLMAVTNKKGIIKDKHTMAIVINNNEQVYINISEKGIITSTLKCYKDKRYEDEITNLEFIYDEFDNLKRINLPPETDSELKYLIYDYNPESYHIKVKQIWISRLADDEQKKEDAEEELEAITDTLIDIQQQYDILLREKQQEIVNFEHMMGPALREGNWQPEDYKDYGDKHIVDINISNNIVDTSEDMVYFKWDEPKFDEEFKTYFEIQANQSHEYYLAIVLTSEMLTQLKIKKNYIKKLSLLYYDYTAVEGYPHKPQYRRALTLGSKMFFAFAKINNNSALQPILLITGTNELSENQIAFLLRESGKTTGDPVLGVLSVSFENDTYQVSEEDWVENVSIIRLNENSKIYYPRIIINSLSLKTSSDELILSDVNKVFKNFEDYSVLTYETDECYYLTIRPETLIENYYEEWNPVNLNLRYSISNASTAIYLDAIQVLKDSSIPQVSYSVDISLIQKERIKTTAKLLNRIVHINDNELKFENVQGYVSEVTLNLDEPWEDKIEIKNYKTKFEDLFEKIVASSEQMKKNEYISGIVSDTFDNTGLLSIDAAQDIADKIAAYSFDGGNLTITKEHGILAESKEGIVAMRGDGIFTAIEKDDEGNWNWTSGITPSGINANLITAGQIDTNRLRIFAGDQLRFQMNADGLFAYRAKPETIGEDENQIDIEIPDVKTYVVMNEDGLFLHRSPIDNDDPDRNEYNKVEVSWGGLIIRNGPDPGNQVFFADELGNLTLSGEIIAESGNIGKWFIADETGEGIYYISNTEAIPEGSTIWSASELYLGLEGLKLGNSFQIKTNVNSDKPFQSFTILNPENDDEDPSEDNFLFKIAPIEDGKTYELNIRNVNFGEDFINQLVQTARIGIYSTVKLNANNKPIFDDDAPNGSIGAFYTSPEKEIDESAQTSIFAANAYPFTTSDIGFFPGIYNIDDQHTGIKFGISAKRWNVTRGSGGGSPSSGFTTYVRAGVADISSNTSAAVGRMRVKTGPQYTGISAEDKFRITFAYSQANGNTWNILSNGTERATSFNIKIFNGTASSNLVASGTVNIPPSVYKGTIAKNLISVELTASAAINENDILYCVIYSTNLRSLTFIDVQTMSIGEVNVEPVENDNYSIWLKSNNTWHNILPELGDGLTYDSNGKLTVRLGQGLAFSSTGEIVLSNI